MWPGALVSVRLRGGAAPVGSLPARVPAADVQARGTGTFYRLAEARDGRASVRAARGRENDKVMKKPMMFRVGAAAALLVAAGQVFAFNMRPDGVSFEAGPGRTGTNMAGVGLVWDWDFERMRRKSELTAHTELLVNRWRADALGGGHQQLTQLVVLPSLRMRLDRGRSPWFIELGIGASFLSKHFETPDKNFSTRWNFYDVLGVGHTFGGPNGQNELGLRWTHTSNAGIRKPNPGQDFLQVRYAHRF
jgi:lipid A 3-O-deacylase